MAYVPDLSDVFVQGGTPPQVAKDLESRLVSVDPVTGAVSDPRIQALVSGGGKTQRTAALLGDSIANQNLTGTPGVAGTSLSYQGNGWLIWANSRLGWVWDIQHGDQFAVNGTSTSIMLNEQLPALLEANKTRKYDRAFISSATNDLASGTPLAGVKANLLATFLGLAAANVRPSYIGYLPRGITGTLSVAAKRGLALNAWAAELAAAGVAGLEFITGAYECLADTSTPYGLTLAALMDGSYLHPNDRGGYILGEVIYNYYKDKGLSSVLQFAQSPADIYDATDNPQGVCFKAANPYLVGGTTAPTGMTTAGANTTWSVGTTALPSGAAKPFAKAVIAGATTCYIYDDNTTAAGWTGADSIAEGDVVYMQALVEVTVEGAGLKPILSFVESNGVTSCSAQCLNTIAGDVLTLPAGTKLALRTPNIVVRPYGGSGGAALSSQLRFYSPGVAGEFKVLAFELRKYLS